MCFADCGFGFADADQIPGTSLRKLEKWDRQDSNLQPRDYAYHHDFRRPFRVRGLDHPFTIFSPAMIPNSVCCETELP